MAEPDAAPPVRAWPEPRLLALQVKEVFGFAQTAAAFSYFGSLLTLGVLVQAGDARRGAFWFAYATLVAFLRAFLILGFRRRPVGSRYEPWRNYLLAVNGLAGLQWGIVGTVLFPSGPVHEQLFMIMVIICFVAGSVTAYAAVRWAHEIITVTATFPAVVYLFFLRDGAHWYAGIAGLFFSFAMLHYAGRLHAHMRRTFELQLERDDLLALTDALNRRLEEEKRELAHRAAVRGVSMEAARDHAERLAALFDRSPLPQLECDGSGRLIACNAAARVLLQHGIEALVGTPIGQWLAGVGQAPLELEALRRAAVLEVEVRCGEAIERCAASITPLVASDGHRVGYGVTLLRVPAAVAS